MPFRIQCISCRKFMIVEDEMRGRRVECLICSKPITADVEPKPPTVPDDPQIRSCPKCGSRMRVSSTAARVRCPKCQHVF
jgi:DNA-directed RNA polymerase subunit RPC12/RpoP